MNLFRRPPKPDAPASPTSEDRAAARARKVAEDAREWRAWERAEAERQAGEFEALQRAASVEMVKASCQRNGFWFPGDITGSVMRDTRHEWAAFRWFRERIEGLLG